jgi:hypothetical protein
MNGRCTYGMARQYSGGRIDGWSELALWGWPKFSCRDAKRVRMAISHRELLGMRDLL